MSTVVTLAAAASAEIRSDNPNTNYSSDETAIIEWEHTLNRELLIAFAVPLAEYQYNNIAGFHLEFYSYNSLYNMRAEVLEAAFIENQVTWNNAPASMASSSGNTTRVSESRPYLMQANIPEDRLAMLCVKNGVKIVKQWSGSTSTPVYTTRSQNKPSAEVVFNDAIVEPIIISATPSGGYVNPRVDNTFRWEVGFDGYCFGELYIAHTYFGWRIAGSGDEPFAVDITENEFTVPADFFPTGAIEWSIIPVDNRGHTVQLPWTVLTTVDSIPTVTGISPASIMVDGSKPITFRWNYSNATGTPQTKAEIRISTDGSTWTTAATIIGSATSWTAPENTFSGGIMYWSVRGYNLDDVASEWSASNEVAVVAAPAMPTVSATGTPQSLILWQAAGQEAAEISVDGRAAPIVWGGTKEYTWPEILGDGVHVIRVRVQNSYGLWSEWGEYPAMIANTPGSAIDLSATSAEMSVYLSWTLIGSAEYQILRDGAVIASVPAGENSFVDDGAGAGTHTYQVRGIDAGNYTPSNEASVSCSVPGIVIKPEDDDWIVLGLTTANPQTINERIEKPASIVYYSGSALPEIEHSGQLSHVYSFKPSFPGDQAATAEKLISAVGKTVLIKDLYGAAFFGVLSVVPRERTPHRQTFDISITEVRK